MIIYVGILFAKRGNARDRRRRSWEIPLRRGILCNRVDPVSNGCRSPDAP